MRLWFTFVLWWLAIGPAAATAPVSPARQADERAATIGFRLATHGLLHCPRRSPLIGASFQVLDQFAVPDRPSAIAQFRLDRGPRVIAVAAQGPGAAAGLMPGDVILSAGGRSLQPDGGAPGHFDQAAALAALDRIDTVITDEAAAGPVVLTVMRDGAERSLSLRAVSGCPLHLHVARSDQRNAYADGTHILVPAGLIDRIADDNQLALIIAHEMAHNILGHAALRRASDAAHRVSVRRMEDEADTLGANLAIDAGYDVIAGSRVFLLSGGIDLFSAHRRPAERMRIIAEQLRLRTAAASSGTR